VPFLSQPAGSFLLVWALVLGIGQLVCAIFFYLQKYDPAARRLHMASLLYLPAMMCLLALGPLA
jgi:heme O synthase-like polyprenyltransferase